MPAHPLAPGDVAVGATVGLVLPTGELERGLDEQPDLAVLANAGFGATASVRLGLVRRVEALVAGGPAHVGLGVRWAALVPEEGAEDWELVLAGHGLLILGGADEPPEDVERSVFGGGGGADVRFGRTWSDFVSVWVAAGGGAMFANHDGTSSGLPWAEHTTLSWVGGTLGLRVGLRNVFTGIELGARWTSASSGLTDYAGLVLIPAIGLSIETR